MKQTMYLWILGASIVVAGVVYYCRAESMTETKNIRITWSGEKQETVDKKIKSLRFGTLQERWHNMAEFRYDYKTCGKLSRWRDKGYIDDVRISPLWVPA